MKPGQMSDGSGRPSRSGGAESDSRQAVLKPARAFILAKAAETENRKGTHGYIREELAVTLNRHVASQPLRSNSDGDGKHVTAAHRSGQPLICPIGHTMASLNLPRTR